MNKLIILAVIIFGAYHTWQKWGGPAALQPMHDEAYVAVYGRNTCGITQKMLSDLDAAGVDYEYHQVDDEQVANTLHARMEASGISTRQYNLPVVDVNGSLSVRPGFDAVLSAYQAGQ